MSKKTWNLDTRIRIYTSIQTVRLLWQPQIPIHLDQTRSRIVLKQHHSRRQCNTLLSAEQNVSSKIHRTQAVLSHIIETDYTGHQGSMIESKLSFLALSKQVASDLLALMKVVENNHLRKHTQRLDIFSEKPLCRKYVMQQETAEQPIFECQWKGLRLLGYCSSWRCLGVYIILSYLEPQ